MKQTKLRRRRVVRYAILYFVLLVVFLALIVGPAVAGRYINLDKLNISILDDMHLLQPTSLSNDDTRGTQATGVKNPSYTGVMTTTRTASGTARATTTRAR
jgi:1,3-beta-glucan synthase